MTMTEEDRQNTPIYERYSDVNIVSNTNEQSYENRNNGFSQPMSTREEMHLQNCHCNSNSRSRSKPLSENKRRKVASIFCISGVLGIAAGSITIFIYLIGEFTTIFGKIENLQAVSIPGFSFLVLGIILSVIGIFFCWIYSSEDSTSLASQREDETISSPSAISTSGRFEYQAAGIDSPPSYNSFSLYRKTTSVLMQSNSSFEKLPSYIEALSLNKEENKLHGECKDVVVEFDVTETPPPPY